MFAFLEMLFALVRVGGTSVPAPSRGYYEGDDSPWVMADGGPILPR